MRRRLGMMLSGMLCGTLGACATTTGFGETDFCVAAKPIYWSTKDTDKTIWQVKEHNASGKVLCGWGK